MARDPRTDQAFGCAAVALALAAAGIPLVWALPWFSSSTRVVATVVGPIAFFMWWLLRPRRSTNYPSLILADGALRSRWSENEICTFCRRQAAWDWLSLRRSARFLIRGLGEASICEACCRAAVTHEVREARAPGLRCDFCGNALIEPSVVSCDGSTHICGSCLETIRSSKPVVPAG